MPCVPVGTLAPELPRSGLAASRCSRVGGALLLGGGAVLLVALALERALLLVGLAVLLGLPPPRARRLAAARSLRALGLALGGGAAALAGRLAARAGEHGVGLHATRRGTPAVVDGFAGSTTSGCARDGRHGGLVVRGAHDLLDDDRAAAGAAGQRGADRQLGAEARGRRPRAGRSRRAARRRPPAAAAAAPPPPPPRAPKIVSFRPALGQHRQHERERVALLVHRVLVGAAAVAERQVAAQRAAAQLAAARGRELLADVLARRLARVAVGDQPGARLVHERLDLGRRHVDHRGDLGMGEVADLGEHERGALVVGQPRDVAQQRAQVRALLDAGG